jgi:hypothetical protein
MNTYRLYCEAVKSASLGSDAVLRYIPCDRNAYLSEVMIVSRAGITANATHYSKFQVKNGSTVLFERSFDADDLAAATNEALAPLADSNVSETTELAINYDATGNGLALDLDVVLVFELARG